MWFRVDDRVNSNYKMIGLSDTALALWIRCGVWAADQLTDGFVPSQVVHHFAVGNTWAIDELVERNLWELDGRRDGIVFHDWLNYQRSRSDVLRDRDAARERQRKRRSLRSRRESQPVTRKTPVERSHGDRPSDGQKRDRFGRFIPQVDTVTSVSPVEFATPLPPNGGSPAPSGVGAGRPPTQEDAKAAAEKGMELIRAEIAKRKKTPDAD